MAFAFALFQLLEVVAVSYHSPDQAMHVVFWLLVLDFALELISA